MNPREFVADLASVHLPSVFNPYADICSVYDLPNAPKLRKKNLEHVLAAALASSVRTIWIARDLGYRGGRRTGVPLTDEFHLDVAGHFLGEVHLRRATHGPIVREKTATVIWKALRQIREPVVLWNVFPLHPHEMDDQFSNRGHTKAEREVGLSVLRKLIEMIRPQRLIAIGRDAQHALQHINIPTALVRHPSYGGQSEFTSGVLELYGVHLSADVEPSFLDDDLSKPQRAN